MSKKTAYNEIIHDIILNLAEMGKNQTEIAATIGITDRTLRIWKKKYPELEQDLKASREVAEKVVEAAMFRLAIGFQMKETKVHFDQFGQVNTFDMVKQVAPSFQAGSFLLKNWNPDKYKEKQEIKIDKIEGFDNLEDAKEFMASDPALISPKEYKDEFNGDNTGKSG